MQDLAGFPVVLAISEDSINNQLACVSVRTHDLPEQWHLGSDSDDWRLDITDFEAPQIDFNTVIKNGCRLKMRVNKGSFSIDTIKKDLQTGKKEVVTESFPLDGISFYITTPVDCIKKKGESQDGRLGEEIFLVQTLFADITQVKDITLEGMSQEIKVKITSSVEASLKELIKIQIQAIAVKNPQALLFGSVLVPTIPDKKEAHGVLAPKGMNYSVSKIINDGQYRTGVLNYLLWVDDPTAMPIGDAVGAFDQPLLLNDGDIDAPATLVISDYILWEKFIKPQMELFYTSDKPGHEIPSFEVDHRQGESTAKLKLKNSFYYEHDGDDQHRFDRIEGAMSDKLHIEYDMYVRRQHWSGDVYGKGSGFIDLLFSYIDGKFDTAYTAPEPTVDTEMSLFTRILGDIISLGFDEIGINARQKEAKDRLKNIGASIAPSLDQLLDLIEFPGKSVFDFDKVVMKGNLYLRARYKEFISQ
ncbi:MAG: hypothetical protein RMX35_25390 [Nostoc sp. DcaGUA01]|nr:hypothetical protein [Nostoc sp. DcaGUA01]